MHAFLMNKIPLKVQPQTNPFAKVTKDISMYEHLIYFHGWLFVACATSFQHVPLASVYPSVNELYYCGHLFFTAH